MSPTKDVPEDLADLLTPAGKASATAAVAHLNLVPEVLSS